MSSIPPNVVGPILQAGTAQRQASRVLENEREQQETAFRSASRVSDRLDAVDETDNDTQVNSDAEGLGSQGKFAAQPDDEQADEPSTESATGITRDDDGHVHVDLEA